MASDDEEDPSNEVKMVMTKVGTAGSSSAPLKEPGAATALSKHQPEQNVQSNHVIFNHFFQT